MSAGVSAMVRGNTLSSNISTLANESAFTETGGALNHPRNYHEAYKNMQTVKELSDKGVVEEDILDRLEWAKPLDFQESYEKITPVRQTAENSNLPSGTVLEFNIIVPKGQYTRPADLELVLPVRFQDTNGKKST